MATLRSFIAIELPEETKLELARLQNRLKASCGYCPAKWVAPQSIHLTLNFLGDVDTARLEEIKQAIALTASQFEPFELRLAESGAFPNLERPQVVWVGLKGDIGRLEQIQKQLELRLVPLGFRAENRPFSPHLTLARLRDEASAGDRKRLGQAIAAAACDTGCMVPVTAINLMKSELTSAGPVYTRLASIALGE